MSTTQQISIERVSTHQSSNGRYAIDSEYIALLQKLLLDKWSGKVELNISDGVMMSCNVNQHVKLIGAKAAAVRAKALKRGHVRN